MAVRCAQCFSIRLPIRRREGRWVGTEWERYNNILYSQYNGGNGAPAADSIKETKKEKEEK